MYLALLSPLPFLPDRPCYNLPTAQRAAELKINTKVISVGNTLAYTYYQQKGKKKIRFFSFGHLLCLSDPEREWEVTETQGPFSALLGTCLFLDNSHNHKATLDPTPLPPTPLKPRMPESRSH